MEIEEKKLFIPGPVEVSRRVREAMACPMMGHREPRYRDLQKSVIDQLKQLFATENRVFIGSSSSTGLMEAAVRNCVESKSLHFVNGAFSKRWVQIAEACGKEPSVVDVEWGSGATKELLSEKLADEFFDAVFVTHNETSTAAMTPLDGFADVVHDAGSLLCVDAVSSAGGVPLPIDELGIDVLVTGTQKAFAVPPGLSIGVVSQAAFDKSAEMSAKGAYFDYHVMEKYAVKDQTYSTPSIPHLNAMDVQLGYILNEEGADNRYRRHEELASYTREWGAKHFDVFTQDGFHSNTVSCFKNTVDADLADLSAKLAEKGYVFSNGYGKLKGEAFRVAHMGERKMEDLKEYLETIEDLLGL